MNSFFVITLDTDWCPEYMLREVLEMLDSHGVRGTFFCTDIFDFTESPDIETAIHPNFMADSTQGDTEEAIVASLQQNTGALGARTHRMFWHGGLLSVFAKNHIVYDSSLFLPCAPYLQPFRHDDLTRFPVWWVDNMHLRQKFDLHRVDTIPNFSLPGLKVLDFHPINIFFNHASPEDLQTKNRAFYADSTMSEDKARSLVNPGDGLRTVFECFLRHLAEKQEKTWRLRDLLAMNRTDGLSYAR